ncbi:DUF397 domain-containing protein [Streptomyces sp. A5-4]|uniref:DUF397 domain-containing protein n=1 Tax=Streptomyces sp. A5-4 TaxID=3384771 RepID=UPI003DA7D614
MRIRHDELTEWTKSSYSAVNGDCVEIKTASRGAVAVRDSKAPDCGTLGFTEGTWSAFILDVGRSTQRRA